MTADRQGDSVPSMGRFLMFLAAIFVVLVLAFAAAFLILGPERLWARFGPADLGDVDFATLVRRETPNDALACLPEYCAAKADIPAPVIALPVAQAFPAVEQALLREPRVRLAAADPALGTLRFVQRSRFMGFPDTINVRLVPTADGGSAVLIYSRSQLGRADMGVNLARVKRWVDLIVTEASKDAP